jgi:general stress protein YciG
MPGDKRTFYRDRGLAVEAGKKGGMARAKKAISES